jgi:hypothetical protein
MAAMLAVKGSTTRVVACEARYTCGGGKAQALVAAELDTFLQVGISYGSLAQIILQRQTRLSPPSCLSASASAHPGAHTKYGVKREKNAY